MSNEDTIKAIKKALKDDELSSFDRKYFEIYFKIPLNARFFLAFFVSYFI